MMWSAKKVMPILFALECVASCYKAGQTPIDAEPVLEIRTDTPEFQTTSAASIIERVRTSLTKETPIIALRFNGGDEPTEILIRNGVDSGSGLIACGTLMRINLDTYFYEDESLSDTELKERLSEYAEVGRLTGSVPIIYLLFAPNLPASRLYEFANFQSSVKPPLPFTLPTSIPY